MKDQMLQFNERVQRIMDPNNVSYKDPVTGMDIPRRVSIHKIKPGGKLVKAKSGPLFLIISFLMGVVAICAARYLRFVVAEIPDVGTQASGLAAVDFGIAAFMTFVLGALIGHRSIRHAVAQAMGICVMMVSMHNLIWLFPNEASQVFPSTYIEQVRATTEPQSLYIAGNSITL